MLQYGRNYFRGYTKCITGGIYFFLIIIVFLCFYQFTFLCLNDLIKFKYCSEGITKELPNVCGIFLSEQCQAHRGRFSRFHRRIGPPPGQVATPSQASCWMLEERVTESCGEKVSGTPPLKSAGAAWNLDVVVFAHKQTHRPF